MRRMNQITNRKQNRANKSWTKAELNYLEEKWGTTSLKTICRNLGRSESAVIQKIQRLGLGPALQNGKRMSWNTFIITLTGTNGGYYKKRLTAAGLPVHTQIVQGHNGKRYTTVDIDEFWEFAEQNKDLFNFSKLEYLAFGPEPEWATLKRRLDAERKRTKHEHNDPWTEEDDRKLKRLLDKNKYTYPQIADMLRRSEGAVKKRIHTLALVDLPLRCGNKNWTQEEVLQLIELRNNGYGWDNIAKELDRSENSVRGKYERLLNPEYMKRKHRGCSSIEYVKLRDIKADEMIEYIKFHELHQDIEFAQADPI